MGGVPGGWVAGGLVGGVPGGWVTGPPAGLVGGGGAGAGLVGFFGTLDWLRPSAAVNGGADGWGGAYGC